MFTIRELNLEEYHPSWRCWESFLSTDPIPTKLPIKDLYIAYSVFDFQATKTIGFFADDALLGGTCIFAKEAPGLFLGGVGKMAVDPRFRRNGIASRLLGVSLLYMFLHQFHISLLWASVLELYEKFGYVPLTRDHQETNMMYRPIMGLPLGWSKERLLDLPSQIGTF